jgi:hypothetical protein
MQSMESHAFFTLNSSPFLAKWLKLETGSGCVPERAGSVAYL